MPRTLQDTLSHLPTEVLRDLARAHRIDRGRQAERTLLIETLLSLPDPDAAVVEADRARTRGSRSGVCVPPGVPGQCDGRVPDRGGPPWASGRACLAR